MLYRTPQDPVRPPCSRQDHGGGAVGGHRVSRATIDHLAFKWCRWWGGGTSVPTILVAQTRAGHRVQQIGQGIETRRSKTQGCIARSLLLHVFSVLAMLGYSLCPRSIAHAWMEPRLFKYSSCLVGVLLLATITRVHSSLASLFGTFGWNYAAPCLSVLWLEVCSW